MKRLPSARNWRVGEFSSQPVGHSSRTTVRQAPLSGEQAASSMMFCQRLVRLTSSSVPSGLHSIPYT